MTSDQTIFATVAVGFAPCTGLGLGDIEGAAIAGSAAYCQIGYETISRRSKAAKLSCGHVSIATILELASATECAGFCSP
jgi:hypothetical protein